MNDDNDVVLRLWESAETAIRTVAEREMTSGIVPVRSMARAAVVAVLRELSTDVAVAEEDDEIWPDSGDLLILAGELEESDV